MSSVDQVAPEVMAEMRAQAKECEWREAQDNCLTSDEYIDELSDAEVLAHYERQPGGVDQFKRDSGLA